jgi:hypothetical protein
MIPFVTLLTGRGRSGVRAQGLPRKACGVQNIDSARFVSSRRVHSTTVRKQLSSAPAIRHHRVTPGHGAHFFLLAASPKSRQATDVHHARWTSCSGTVSHDPRDLSTKPAFGVWARRFEPLRPDNADCVTLRGADGSCPRCCARRRSDDRDRAAPGETHETYSAASRKAHPPSGTSANKARGTTGAPYDTPRGSRYSARYARYVAPIKADCCLARTGSANCPCGRNTDLR